MTRVGRPDSEGMHLHVTIASSSILPLWQAVLLLAPAAVASAAIIMVSRVASVAVAWRWARGACSAMLAAALASAVVRVVTQARAGGVVRSDTVGVSMLVLVSFIAWVVVRYSDAYLRGDPHERLYIGRLLATVASVAVVVVANDLAVLVVAWTATSLALHGLLTFFGDRPAAIAAAHKKFVLARCADLAMVAAVICFGVTFKTLRIDEIVAQASTSATLPAGARAAVALVALAALLKTAQLPFHGWLIQVMEAPTPVSALLHAGIVNLGGFVLLRFAPVVDRAVETRTLLVVVGASTAVVAALVMTTRISIKVALAWSTCAQMGFMLMQCGLGAWEMAFLHLLAHSLYKAHAFLGAGGAVRQTQRRRLAPAQGAPTVGTLSIGVVTAVAGTIAAGWAWGRLPSVDPASATVWVLGGIVALALVPLTTATVGVRGRRLRIVQVAATGAVPVAYFGLHALFGRLVAHASSVPTGLLVFAAAAFALLFVLQVVRVLMPASTLMTWLYPRIYGGLFLDEWFTRAAFSIWPPPEPRRRSTALPQWEAGAGIGSRS